MNQVLEIYIKIIQSAFNEQKIDLNNFDQYEDLFKLAERQNSFGFLYYGLKNSTAPKEFLDRVGKKYKSVLHQQIMQDYYADLIFKKLEENNIDYMPLKGYVMRKYYRNPDMRTSCDLDFFYNKNNRNKVKQIMLDLGFSKKGENDKDDGYFIAPSVSVEAHFLLNSSTTSEVEKYCVEVVDRLVKKDENKNQLSFTLEDFYIYMLSHTFRHFMGGGSGIKSITDIYVFEKTFPNLDKNYLSDTLVKLGLDKFAKTLSYLAKYWIDGETQFCEDLSLEQIEKVGQYVLCGGAYGNSIDSGSMGNTKKKPLNAKISFAFKRIFPRLKTMKTTYKFLNTFPFLLPIAWVMRFFTVLFQRPKNIKRDINVLRSMNESKLDSAKEIKNILGLQ